MPFTSFYPVPGFSDFMCFFLFNIQSNAIQETIPAYSSSRLIKNCKHENHKNIAPGR